VTSEMIAKGAAPQRVAVVDVAHEALIRHWALLRSWLEESRDRLRQLRKLESAAEEWRDRGQKPDDLLQGRAIANAQQFQKEQAEHDSLNPLLKSFITKSIKQRRRNLLKLIGLNLFIPLSSAIFVGIQIESNVRVWSNRELVKQASGKVDDPARTVALQALVKAGEPLLAINLAKANLSGANLFSADLSSAVFSSANLNSANLNSAILSSAILKGANLTLVDFFSANLSSADLRGTNLSSANLSEANLRGADLSDAILSSAILSDATLSSAILLSTNLRNVKELSQQQLEKKNAPLLCNVALPQNQGISVNPNRDCDRLPKVLLERYPNEFETLEKAKAHVDEARKKRWDN